MLPLQRLVAVAACLPVLVASVGCGPSKNEFDALAFKHAKLEQEVTSLKTSSKELRDTAAKAFQEFDKRLVASQSETKDELMQVKLALIRKLDEDGAAVLDSSDKGFAVARTSYGSFAISLDDAQPYLDGHKVRLRIGNMTNARMTGVQLEVTYGLRVPLVPDTKDMSVEAQGKAIDEFAKANDAANASRKSMKTAVDGDLLPGAWTIAEFVISPSKPADLGRIEVLVRPRGVSLSQPR